MKKKRKSRQEQFDSLSKQVLGYCFSTLILLSDTKKKNREKDPKESKERNPFSRDKLQ